MTEFIFVTLFGDWQKRIIPTHKLKKYKQNGWVMQGQDVLKTPKTETVKLPKYKWNLKLMFESQIIE